MEVDQNSNVAEIVAINEATGTRRSIYTAASGAVRSSLVVLSPDGQRVALVEVIEPETVTTKIVLVDLETAAAVDLVLPRDGGMPTSPVWSPDSTQLAYVWFNPAQASVELWVADLVSQQQWCLAPTDRFWAVLVFGKTRSVAWEEGGQAIQFFDDRTQTIYRVMLDGTITKIADRKGAAPGLVPYLQLLEAPAALSDYDGMQKPLNIRDYNDTCWDGYTGLYPDYGGCVLSGPHPAVDMAGGSTGIGCGTPVVAVCVGPIISVEAVPGAAAYGVCGDNTGAPDKGTMNLGWQIVLRCDNIPYEDGYGGTVYAIYAHLSYIEPGLGWGVWVDKGAKLGEVGSTGYSSGPHLHFQMERDNQPHHPWWWTTTGEILTYTWNPMYFIQAHEDYVPGPTPTPPPSTWCLKPLIRYWSDSMHKHFYTLDWNELGSGKDGWVYEGVEGYAAMNASCYAPGAKPLYRLWHDGWQKHFYTTSEAEKDTAIQVGYVLEAISGYVLGSSNSQYYTEPLYRSYHSGMNDHFYTTDWSEVETAVSLGYQYEHVEGHVFGRTALVPTPVPTMMPTSTVASQQIYLPLVLRRAR
ncbi:MAG: peptidoglycan DD-metalloendopeptidase family protein [Anaerolineae bacterium]|nr:peptidoglycan DD-metalloendopeptidase family protein [Anaerolineae bacterium]